MTERVILIVPNVSHPRFHRRAVALMASGYHVVVYGFDRSVYSMNRFPQGVEVRILGKVDNGRYVRRIPKLIAASKYIRRKELAERNALRAVYAFGLDTLVIARAAGLANFPVVYEIGDLRNPNPRGPLGRSLYAMERRLIRMVDLLVVTSEGFLREYFAGMDRGIHERTVIVENRLPSRPLRLPSPHTNNVEISTAKVVIGIVGVLRYRRTLVPLIDAVASRPTRFELSVHGDGPLRNIVTRAARKYSNIHYAGPFQNPRDLAEIYSTVHVNYVVYDNNDVNVRLAIPNKLFESIYYGVPMIVASDTELAKRVNRMGIGFAVDPRRRGFIDDFLDRIEPNELVARARRMRSVPREELIDDGRLIERIAHMLATADKFTSNVSSV